MRGVPGGSGGSVSPALGKPGWNDYSRVDMVGLRNLAFAEDEGATWQQVVAWRMAFELSDAQRGRLARYREVLARKWSGPAAELFLAEMDRQIDSLSSLGETALANERQAQVVAYSVQETQQKVELLRQAWQIRRGPNGGRPMTDLAGQQRLTEQAREVVIAHSDTVVHASFMMIQPGRYQPPGPKFGMSEFTLPEPPDGGSGGSTTGGWRTLPSVVSPGPGLVGSVSVPSGGLAVDAPSGLSVHGDPSGSSVVPVSSWPATRVPGSAWIEPNTGRRVAPPVLGAKPPGLPVEPGVERPVPGAARNTPGRPVGGLPVEDPLGRGVSGERGMSGMPVGGGAGPVGRGGESARSVRRVNPVGGVIGGGPQPVGETHTRPDGYTVTMSTSQERPAVTRRPAVDPFAQWPIREGVPPAIYPPPEPCHDPGPGVIGIDR